MSAFDPLQTLGSVPVLKVPQPSDALDQVINRALMKYDVVGSWPGILRVVEAFTLALLEPSALTAP